MRQLRRPVIGRIVLPVVTEMTTKKKKMLTKPTAGIYCRSGTTNCTVDTAVSVLSDGAAKAAFEAATAAGVLRVTKPEQLH